jgi:hypothetical protein
MRRWALAGAALVIALAIVWFALQRSAHPEHVRAVKSRRVDVAAFQADVAQRLERARKLAPAPPAPARPATSASKLFRTGVAPHAGADLIEHQCILGPQTLCTALTPLVTACDGGDARACMAVAEYLADTPPRPLIATMYFAQACRIGDVEGCERIDDTKGPIPDDCAADPFVCAWRASRAHDQPELAQAALDQACALGVADACAYMALATKGDAAAARAYLEAGCQLGSPMQCAALGHALLPTCTPSADQPCYPPDPAQATAALAIACAAGWGGSDCP